MLDRPGRPRADRVAALPESELPPRIPVGGGGLFACCLGGGGAQAEEMERQVQLVVATANIILALLAVGCIACIVVCCIGFLVLCGWSFGFIEAVCISICVGFSIDFVAHIAVAYNESAPELPRYERTRRALEDLGISVTAATVTTSGAALFMLPNRMIPYQKSGAFITFHICVSLLFAVGLFSALRATVGPQGGQGTVRWLRCKPHRRRRSVEVRPPGEAADETEAMTAR